MKCIWLTEFKSTNHTGDTREEELQGRQVRFQCGLRFGWNQRLLQVIQLVNLWSLPVYRSAFYSGLGVSLCFGQQKKVYLGTNNCRSEWQRWFETNDPKSLLSWSLFLASFSYQAYLMKWFFDLVNFVQWVQSLTIVMVLIVLWFNFLSLQRTFDGVGRNMTFLARFSSEARGIEKNLPSSEFFQFHS
jgi:hypothetical protein